MIISKSLLYSIAIALLAAFSNATPAAEEYTEGQKRALQKALESAKKMEFFLDLKNRNPYLTGTWVGAYDYDNRTPNTPPANTFTLVMKSEGYAIDAVIIEPAVVPEQYAALAQVTDTRVSLNNFIFKKTYRDGTTINYQLRMNAKNKTMKGTWEIPEGPSGTVKMKKVEVNDFF
ncbi:hypothetical protein [Kangiella sediminilitoris]|uniref:Uncharacterized protein n=1 Tax=Kangiella sediminilitoris TaxID=1144748 RepID=A0A1B3BBZ8_9GAMM|nr:hypothetical protein [Kangiella sediminilitoris]AOE50316.1 hypothetical protein KS2013_1606 [Kangiella sediminilitoris]